MTWYWAVVPITMDADPERFGQRHPMDCSLNGQDRGVAPPGLPTPKFYTPLRQLLAVVKGGAHFRATTMEDILSGTKPPFTVQATLAAATGRGVPH